MASLTILEILYIVLIIFTTIIGTLLTLVLLRTLKILKVGTELADMYFKVMQILTEASLIPIVFREKLLELVSYYRGAEEEYEESEKEPK